LARVPGAAWLLRRWLGRTHDDLLAADGTYAALWDAFTGESELVAL
jgi:hypothetical protein